MLFQIIAVVVVSALIWGTILITIEAIKDAWNTKFNKKLDK